MGNYSNIKDSVQNAVYENNVGAVTGTSMQVLLTEIINSVGLNSNFMGFLSAGNKPSASVDEKQFYVGCNESTMALSIDLSAVNLGTLTINKSNIYIVYSDASGWQKKDVAAGIASLIPNMNYYNPKPSLIDMEGQISIGELKLNSIYKCRECTAIGINNYGYDYGEPDNFKIPPIKMYIETLEAFTISTSRLPSVRIKEGDSLTLEDGCTYIVTIWNDLWSVEKYS